jgi:hypothetical protein
MGGLNALLGGHPEGVACMCLLRVLFSLLDIRPKPYNQEITSHIQSNKADLLPT